LAENKRTGRVMYSRITERSEPAANWVSPSAIDCSEQFLTSTSSVAAAVYILVVYGAPVLLLHGVITLMSATDSVQ